METVREILINLRLHVNASYPSTTLIPYQKHQDWENKTQECFKLNSFASLASGWLLEHYKLTRVLDFSNTCVSISLLFLAVDIPAAWIASSLKKQLTCHAFQSTLCFSARGNMTWKNVSLRERRTRTGQELYSAGLWKICYIMEGEEFAASLQYITDQPLPVPSPHYYSYVPKGFTSRREVMAHYYKHQPQSFFFGIPNKRLWQMKKTRDLKEVV